LINVAFTGVDHIDLEACRNRKIAVCNAAGYSTTAVSELTIGLAVSLLRNILVMDTQTRIPAGRNNYNGTELKGKTVGIVGTGQIGMTTAKLFSAFGCKIIAWSRTQRESDFIKYVSLDELFRCSDIISLHIPSTEETAKLINEELLSEMKTSSVIINTARGQVIDYLALSQMLISGRIAGAAIDIYETEPPIPENHPLLSAPNTILLPHIAYATKEAMLKRFEIAKSNIEFFLNGKVQNRIL
jgi:D-3-phosphoglycerate dehydrogenase